MTNQEKASKLLEAAAKAELAAKHYASDSTDKGALLATVARDAIDEVLNAR